MLYRLFAASVTFLFRRVITWTIPRRDEMIEKKSLVRVPAHKDYDAD